MKEIGYICANIEKDFRKKIANNLLNAKWSYFQNNKTGNFSSGIGLQVQQAANFIRAVGLVSAGFVQVVFTCFNCFFNFTNSNIFWIFNGVYNNVFYQNTLLWQKNLLRQCRSIKEFAFKIN